nr:hypothetical protein [uncultured Sphingobacterium sp.]
MVGTISSNTIQTTGHAGYPVSSGGAVFTFGGDNIPTKYVSVIPNLSSNTMHYVQYYNPSGEGLKWYPINKQALSSLNSAVNPGPTYTQSEVQAILTELRGLKIKLRAAKLLAE